MTPAKKAIIQKTKEKRKRKKFLPWGLIHQLLSKWLMIENKLRITPCNQQMKTYHVTSTVSQDPQKSNLKQSMILKRCEGAMGTLYLKDSDDHSIYPRYTTMKTQILEIKDVSMKIRIHDPKLVHHLIYIKNVFAFLKEVD